VSLLLSPQNPLEEKVRGAGRLAFSTNGFSEGGERGHDDYRIECIGKMCHLVQSVPQCSKRSSKLNAPLFSCGEI
jgi:hypothetical protein